MSELVIELSPLIDAPIEKSVELLNTLTLGQLQSFSNAVKLKYSEVEVVKEQMLAFVQLENVPQEDLDKANEILENLYKALQKIEDITNVALEIIKCRQ